MSAHRVFFMLAFALNGVGLSATSAGSDLWEDRPVRITQTAPANFPVSLAAQGVTEGEVRVVLNVSAEGQLLDYLVTGYTRREFADALLAVVRDWSYEPARQRGEPVGSRFEAAFAFQARGLVLSLTPNDTAAIAANRLVRPELTSLVCRQDDLDEPVRAVHVVQPMLPRGVVALRSGRPSAAIDFYIDAEGTIRMPVVLRASHEHYGLAAIDALMQWRFKPPTRDGRPVIVRAIQTFSFPERTK